MFEKKHAMISFCLTVKFIRRAQALLNVLASMIFGLHLVNSLDTCRYLLSYCRIFMKTARPGPSPGFRSREGVKNHKGDHSF